MPIVLARVDDRLIHGQVVVGWRHYLRFDTVYVVDDEVAGDAYLADVLRLAAPDDLAVEVCTVQEAFVSLSASPPGQIVLLFKRPQAALSLVEAGLSLARLNVGNLAAGPGRSRAYRSVSLSPHDDAALDALAERGVQIAFQPTPDDPAVGWDAVRRKRHGDGRSNDFSRS